MPDRPAQEPPRITVVPDLHRPAARRIHAVPDIRRSRPSHLTLLRRDVPGPAPARITPLSPRPTADPTSPAA